MKVRVCYTTYADDDFRMALRHYYGEHGVLATRDEIKTHMENVGSAGDADLMDEWQKCEACQAAWGER